MCCRIDRKAMDCVLDMKVLKLAVMIGIVLAENSNRSAVASYVDSPQARIELDDIGPPGIGNDAIATCLSKSKTVIRSFSSHDKNARWCVAGRPPSRDFLCRVPPNSDPPLRQWQDRLPQRCFGPED